MSDQATVRNIVDALPRPFVYGMSGLYDTELVPSLVDAATEYIQLCRESDQEDVSPLTPTEQAQRDHRVLAALKALYALDEDE